MDVSSVSSTSVGTATNDAGAGPARTPAPAAGATATSGSNTVKASAPSSDQIAKAVGQANDTFTQRNQNLYASIETDKATGIDVVKIVDKDSQQTITQYPSRAIVEIAQALQHASSTGNLLHTQA